MKTRLDGRTIVFLVTEDWYFWSHRLPLARAARDAGARVVVATRLGDHRARILAEGFEVAAIPFDRAGLNPMRDARTLAAIVRLYRRLRPDLAHHVAVKPVLLGTLAARIAGLPRFVNAMAGLGFLFTNEDLRTRVLRAVFLSGLRGFGRSARSWTIVQNDDDRAVLLRAGMPPQRTTTIRGSGVDTAAFGPAAEEPPSPIVAVCVARMLWDKGVGELVEAARMLRAGGVPVTIRLVGSADLDPASVPPDVLRRWGEEGVVEVAGHTSDVAGAYARAHIAVLPSYREGLPKSLLEAAACGLPMIATDVPGCREICRDGTTGILVPARDAQALAAAIARLVADAELRRALGRRARQAAVEEFAEEIVVARTLDVYAALLGGADARTGRRMAAAPEPGA